MKIRLNVSDERYGELEGMLLSAGFEIDDEAELVITEKERYSSYIAVKNKKGEKKLLKKKKYRLRIVDSIIKGIEEYAQMTAGE